MVASALLSLTTPNEIRHRFKYFVHSSQVSMNEVITMNFEEPVVPLILLPQPMASIFIWFF